MKIHKAYRYELKPNKTQLALFTKYAGTARFVWNWALAKRIEEYKKTGKSFSMVEQSREITVLKQKEFAWMYEISKHVPQLVLRNLDEAYKHFFRRIKKGEKPGFPKFKKKGIHNSFSFVQMHKNIKVFLKSIQLPKIKIIRLKEESAIKGKILSATVSREADRWFVSIATEQHIEEPIPVKGEAIGIDLGLKTFATLSNGEKIDAPKPLKKYMKLLKRRSKQHSRKQKGSNNRSKSVLKLARLHRKIKNIRKDFLHKLTTELTKTKSVIVVENLNVKGMMKNKRLSRSISDVAWGEFIQILKYKTKWYGSKLVEAPRFFPSSKTCSSCGYVLKSLSLGKRSWICPECKAEHDRDINAAKNLLNLYTTGKSPESNACGDGSSGCLGGETTVEEAGILSGAL